jgi:hypothetical protein
VAGAPGGASDKPKLSFRGSSGQVVECRYRSSGGKYALESCSDGSTSGQTKQSDWFKLQLDGSPNTGSTEIRLRLGEPDVVGGVVQEQVFYASDPQLAGAALYVPRGAAPAFESFSLELLNQVALGTVIPNAGDSATTVGLAVDVHANSTDSFAFNTVPGAACARIELPYDQATLDRVVGPHGEGAIQAQQLTTLSGITSGAKVLVSAGAATVDPSRRTVSFCVEHLSFYVAVSGSYNANLTAAQILSVPPGTLDENLLTATTLPTLEPGRSYTLNLGFTRTGSTGWSNSDPVLVAAGAPTGTSPPLSVTALPVDLVTGLTAWGTPSSISSTGGFPGAANFIVSITCPVEGQPLNFCLRNSAGTFFGECFSWDIDGAGSVSVPLKERCDGEDNDQDGEIDEDLDDPCYDGPVGTEGVGRCHGGQRECVGGVPGDCVDDVEPTASDICGNGIDDDCDGQIDEEGLTTYYADFDNDGFVGPTITVCGAMPAGYRADPGMGDDCCDLDRRARPDQDAWFAAPNACGSHDYDCSDGSVERRHAIVAFESECVGNRTTQACDPGRTIETPAPSSCGDTVIRTLCNWDGSPATTGMCLPLNNVVVQECH